MLGKMENDLVLLGREHIPLLGGGDIGRYEHPTLASVLKMQNDF